MRSLLILVALLAGLGLWFWLLLRSPTDDSAKAVPIEYTESSEAEVSSTASPETPTTTEDAPPQTDVGMEFPTID